MERVKGLWWAACKRAGCDEEVGRGAAQEDYLKAKGAQQKASVEREAVIFGFGEGAWLSGRGLPEGLQDSPRREERLGWSSHLGGAALMRCFGGEVMAIAADQMWEGNGGRKVTQRYSSRG